MYGLNIELTTCCPLHCPQCYCSLEGGKHIPIEIAMKRVEEAKEHGVELLHLSGGETLCYPDIYELVSYASSLDLKVNVALSGWGFDEKVLKRLIDSGVNGIFISLNGSTKEINSLTRDGYEYAINTLEILRKSGFGNTYINWVMHSNNSADFKNVISLAEQYQVAHLVVLSFKPDSSHALSSFPSGEQIIELAKIIRGYKGTVKIAVETCFSQLLAVIKDTPLFGNLNVGATKGCRAGLFNYCINVDGFFSPCRHLDYYENFKTLDEYLARSIVISKIKKVEENKRFPCDECRYSRYCKPCLAVSSKLHGEVFIGHEVCTLWRSK